MIVCFVKVFDYDCGSPVLCCSSLSDKMIICGTQDSRVFVLDLRNTRFAKFAIARFHWFTSSAWLLTLLV